MRIGMGVSDYGTRTAAGNAGIRGNRFSAAASEAARASEEDRMAVLGNLMWQRTEKDREDSVQTQGMQSLVADGAEESGEAASDRSEAAKIYDAAFKGGKNPIENLRTAPKVPYGHLAKDGVIVYNGVLFVCDERTNSICLGDVSDPKKVINVALSGGGSLRVNRDNIGQLSKAMGMFSPEDMNLIMRAIHEDTKVQSMQKEIEDMEAGIGEQIASDDAAAETGMETPGEANDRMIGETEEGKRKEKPGS